MAAVRKGSGFATGMALRATCSGIVNKRKHTGTSVQRTITWGSRQDGSPRTRTRPSFKMRLRARCSGLAHAPRVRTDHFRRGTTLAIVATGDSACVVSALRQLLDGRPAASHPPVFSSVYLFSNVYLTHDMTNGILVNFGQAFVVNKLRDLLALAGIAARDTLSAAERPPGYDRQASPTMTSNC